MTDLALRSLDASVDATPTGTVESTGNLAPPKRLYGQPRQARLSLATRVVVPLLLLILWTIGSRTGAIPESVLASPVEVMRTAARLTASGVLWHHLSLSLGRAFLGLFFGGALGLVLGVTAGLSKIGEDLLDPSVQMIRSVPFLALVPLFIVWFGIGETAKIMLIATAAAKPMYLNAFGGVRSADRKIVEAARVFGLSNLRLVTDVYLPSALPSLMVGLRLSTSMSLIALIAVEVINTSRGLGFLMLQAQEFFKTGILVVCIVLYALFGLATDLTVRLIERTFLPWRHGVRS